MLDSRVGVVLRYDIQGNRKRAERQEQAERVGQSRAELLGQTRLVERTVRSNWATRQTVVRRVGLLERQAGLSRELRTLYEREYEVGTRSLLDILNTQNALFQAEAELINARSLNTYINYRMLASMGVLLSTLGIEPPEDAKPYARALVNAPDVNAVETGKRFDARSLSKWRRNLD